MGRGAGMDAFLTASATCIWIKDTRLVTALPRTPGIPVLGGVSLPPEGPGGDSDDELDELGGTPAIDDGVSFAGPDVIGLDG